VGEVDSGLALGGKVKVVDRGGAEVAEGRRDFERMRRFLNRREGRDAGGGE
jgi:hypothetical protein